MKQLFQWNQDADGDIVFSVAGVLHFIKYKSSTIVKVGKLNCKPAPKFVNLSY